MPDRILRVIDGPSNNITIGGGKNKSFARQKDEKGTIVAIYLNLSVRTVRLKVQIDDQTIEFPTASKLNTMHLNQAAEFNQAGMILHEFWSTTPFGYALEHPIEFDNGFNLMISNEGTADAVLSNFIVLWEENLTS